VRLLLLALAGLWLLGCGVKAPPRPPLQAMHADAPPPAPPAADGGCCGR